jgi:hypothetical protein
MPIIDIIEMRAACLAFMEAPSLYHGRRDTHVMGAPSGTLGSAGNLARILEARTLQPGTA